jgi:mono/diheme cytochrome c family protein
MKKALVIIGYALGAIVILLAAGAAWIYWSGIPSYEVKLPDYPAIKADSATVAEGKRLASMVCNQCHQAPNGKLEGKYMTDVPAMFGKIWAPNITKHPVHGSGRYSDAELAYLLRTGVKRDGKFAPPWMPKFPHLSDQDLQSIIAYLRSEAPELAASDVVQPDPEPSFMAKFLCRVAFKPLPYPEQAIVAPPASDPVTFGKYLVTAKVECYSCHSQSFETTNMMEPEKTPGYLGGGNPLTGLEGEVVTSANLSPDLETGLGKWTEAQFVQALKTGVRPAGPALRYPMTPYVALTDEEAKAIWAYLKTVPAIKNKIERPVIL